MKVFLSHGSADAGVAREVERILEGEALSVSTAADVADPGEAWPAAVGRAIEQADVVLLVLSKSTRHSSWVEAEAALAMADAQAKPDKRVIPLFLAPPSDVIPPFLLDIHGVDLRLPDRQSRLRHLATTLRKPPLRADDPEVGVSTALERMNEVLDSERFYEALVQRQRSYSGHHYRWIMLGVLIAGVAGWIDVLFWEPRWRESPLRLAIALASFTVGLIWVYVVGRGLDQEYSADQRGPTKEESPQ